MQYLLVSLLEGAGVELGGEDVVAGQRVGGLLARPREVAARLAEHLRSPRVAPGNQPVAPGNRPVAAGNPRAAPSRGSPRSAPGRRPAVSSWRVAPAGRASLQRATVIVNVLRVYTFREAALVITWRNKGGRRGGKEEEEEEEEEEEKKKKKKKKKRNRKKGKKTKREKIIFHNSNYSCLTNPFTPHLDHESIL